VCTRAVCVVQCTTRRGTAHPPTHPHNHSVVAVVTLDAHEASPCRSLAPCTYVRTCRSRQRDVVKLVDLGLAWSSTWSTGLGLPDLLTTRCFSYQTSKFAAELSRTCRADSCARDRQIKCPSRVCRRYLVRTYCASRGSPELLISSCSRWPKWISTVVETELFQGSQTHRHTLATVARQTKVRACKHLPRKRLRLV
jgi:hypothetical protein